jgi:hypothetical protein
MTVEELVQSPQGSAAGAKPAGKGMEGAGWEKGRSSRIEKIKDDQDQQSQA